jgi:hypothetical protein
MCDYKTQKIVNCKRHHVASSHNDTCIPLTIKVGFSSITSNDHPSNIAFTSHKIMRLLWFESFIWLQYAKPNDVHVDQYTCMDNYDKTMWHFVIMGGGGVFHLSLIYVLL